MPFVLAVFVLVLQSPSQETVCGTVAKYHIAGNAVEGCRVTLTLTVPGTADAPATSRDVQIDGTVLRQADRTPWQIFGQEVCVTASRIEIKAAADAPLFGRGAVSRCDASVTPPKVLREVKPSYTGEAMRARIEGNVGLDAVVDVDGTVPEARITRSLYPDLDAEAVRAVRQWRFVPGMVDGKPVRVVIDIDMTFALRK